MGRSPRELPQPGIGPCGYNNMAWQLGLDSTAQRLADTLKNAFLHCANFRLVASDRWRDGDDSGHGLPFCGKNGEV